VCVLEAGREVSSGPSRRCSTARSRPPAASTESLQYRDGQILHDAERDLILRTLERFGGHREKTARALGIGLRTLGLKLKKWREEGHVPEERRRRSVLSTVGLNAGKPGVVGATRGAGTRIAGRIGKR
jgi:DNA-binding NtrC family response regulator